MTCLRSQGAALVLLFSFPTAAAAQVARDAEEESPDCEQVCQAFPDQAPAECVCALTGTSAGGTKAYTIEELLEMTPPEIIAAERAAYLERMEGITTYWLIERSNISPVPTIIPYTRNSPGAWPPFRQVTRPELEEHWIKTDPNLPPDQRATAQAVQDNPAGAVGAMGQAIGAFTDALAGQLPVGGDLLKEKAKGVAAGFDTAATSIAQTLAEDAKAQQDDAFQALEEATAAFWEQASRMLHGIYDIGGPPGTRQFVSEPDLKKMVKAGVSDDTLEEEGQLMCIVLVYDGPPINVEGADGVTYSINRAEKWFTRALDGSIVPVYIRLEITGLMAGGFQSGVLHEETTRWGWDEARPFFFAKRIREMFEPAVQGVSEDASVVDFAETAYLVVKSYAVGGVNEGMPTQADFVDTFDEAGFPGMAPAGTAWP